jgi:F-type H+-transporting ATPase subunit b
MKRNRGRFALTGVLVVLFCCAASAYAADEGGHDTAERATELFKWINFAIVAAAIFWVFAKKLPAFFRRNADTIRSAIATATAAKAEADRKLAEAETKLARLPQEIAEFRAVGQRDAAAEAERLRNAAQTDAQKVAVAAKAEIEAAERAARLELKNIAAKLAVDGAESLLAKQLTPVAQESLISNFVKSLQGRPN